jgi:proteasome lid subunit RPN8/RPN11
MLWLTEAQARALAEHALAEAPREVCGIIAGTEERVLEILPIANVAVDPYHTYYMEERQFTYTLLTLEARGLSLLGFYHSHPTGDPIPSHIDVHQAAYPHTPYMIVGLKGQPRIAAWRINYGQVTPVPLYVGWNPPQPEPTLTTAQKVAVLLSALIAFTVLIVLSLSLLPPAPHIP